MKRRRAKPPKPALNPFPEVDPTPGTLLETVAPLGEAMLADDPAEPPATAAALPPELTRRPPAWVQQVLDRLIRTLLGEVVGLFQAQPTWEVAGRAVGILNRFLSFLAHDAPRLLAPVPFARLPAARRAEIETKLSAEPLRPLLVREAGRKVGLDESTDSLVQESVADYVRTLAALADRLGWQATRQKPEDAAEFYRGLGEGYGAVLDSQGNFTGQTPRTHTYLELLTLWPAIEQLRQRQPPITRDELYGWLVFQGVWCNAPGPEAFHDLCDELKLVTKGRGRPRKRN